MITLGDTLIALCRKAKQEVLLVAPFVKVAVLDRILAEVPEAIPVCCVTRWYPHEIAAGVSDLEVWQRLKDRSNSSLWLRFDLHAKYYRVDQQCLIGSANLTAAALGWRHPANLELLVPYPVEKPELQSFESELFTQAVRVNESIYDQMLEAVKHFPKPQEQLKFPPYLNYKETTLEDDGLEGEFSLTRSLRESNGVYEPTLNKEWFPHTRHPEDLYKAYDNQWERLSSATQFAVTNDLHFLAIPPGLSREGFHSYVGTMLFQQPLVRNVSRTLRQLVD